jgi:hypothetical protein
MGKRMLREAVVPPRRPPRSPRTESYELLSEQSKKGQNNMSHLEMEKRIEEHNMRLAWGDTCNVDRTYHGEPAI